MLRTLQSLPVALLFAAFLCGCTGPVTQGKASRLAVVRSNEEAERVYHVQPFKEEHGELRVESGHWVWDGLTSYGGHDLLSKVIFDDKGLVASVDVRMQANPAEDLRENLKPMPRHVRDNALRIGIPEVMPK